MFLGYAQNCTGVTYHMLKLRSKSIVLIHDIIWQNKTYAEYVSRKENTRTYSYVKQDEYKSNNWAHVKIDIFKKKIKTENIKLKKTLIPSRIIGGKKTYRRLSIVFLSKNKKMK